MRDHCWTAKPAVRHRFASCADLCHFLNREQIPMFQKQYSSWKFDNERRISSASSGLLCILFQSNFNHNLFFICFMFAGGGRWIFSTPAVRDVKTMNSIKSLYKSLYLYFQCEMKQKERHWKSFVVAEDRMSSICYLEEGIYFKNKPKRRCRGGLLGARLTSSSGVSTQTFAI